MNIKKMIQKIYFDRTPLKNSDYEMSRKFFLFEGCAAVGIFSLTSGAFLAGFANYMGATDEFNGIIGAIPASAGVIQMFSSIIFEKLEHRKFLVSMGCLIFRLLLSAMVLIPLLVHGTTTRLVALAGIYGLAYLIASFISPPASNWIVDLTPENMRGTYFAQKDAYALGFITILTIIMGKVLDIFRKHGNEYGGFLVIAFFVMVLTLCNAYFLSRVKEPTGHRKTISIKLKDSLIIPFKNSKYRRVIILFLLWNIGLQIGGPFFAVYMVTGLKLDYTYIMIMGVISSVARVLVAKYWGKLADRKSWFFSTKASIGVLAVAHFLWIFVNARTIWFLVPINHLLGGIAWAGINISIFNIQFVMSPKEGRTMYLGASSALGGIAGFASTLIGSLMIGLLKNFSLNIMGINIINMQVLFALSGIILGITALYVHFFMPRKMAEGRVR